jgi:hypothetical protein
MAKKTYQELLKENLNEFDTTKTVDIKGPMLDPILGYEGDGELPTYKDAASVLERYYFGEKRSEHEINEMDYENDKGDSSGESMKNTEGPEGEEQAGTSNANTTSGSEKEKEKTIAKEDKEVKGKGEVVSEKEMGTADLKSKEMKDADGPEGEEQAGTGDTYSDFKKRVVEAVEAVVAAESLEEKEEEKEDDKKEDDKKEDEKEDDKKEEIKENDEKEDVKKEDDKKEDDKKEDEKEEIKEEQGVVPPGSLQKKMKNEDQGEDYEDATDAKGDGKDVKKVKGVKENGEIVVSVDEEDITEALENEIIEKLISEMEDDAESVTEQDKGEADDKMVAGDKVEEEEEEEEGLDVDTKMEEMVNRLTQGHTEGPEGEEQAGTGGDEKVIPPRKDRSNEGTKEKGTKSMDKAELADKK